MSSSSSFRAERGRRSRDAADADNAPAHSICGKMKSFLFSCVVFYVRERESNVIRKTAFFSLFFIPPKCGTVSQFPSRNRDEAQNGERRNSSNICIQEKLQKYTRRLALTHARLKNFYILSSEEEEERERYVSFARVLFFQGAKEFPPLNLSS